jgi:hypothetical protein
VTDFERGCGLYTVWLNSLPVELWRALYDASHIEKLMRGRIPGDIPGRDEEYPEEVKSMRVASFHTA